MYDRARRESFRTVAVVRISLLVHSFTNALKDIFAFLESNGFVDAFRACRFLCDLIAFPGIREEIARVGGWEMAESHARKILQYDLMKWCPNDAHLVVLSDAYHFFRRVENYKTAMESLIANCEQSLGAMRERFTCGTSLSCSWHKNAIISSAYRRRRCCWPP